VDELATDLVFPVKSSSHDNSSNGQRDKNVMNVRVISVKAIQFIFIKVNNLVIQIRFLISFVNPTNG